LPYLREIRFWARGEKTATPEAARHFVEAFTDYLNSVIVQAADRDDDKVRTVEEYMHTRRQNIGARPSYVPGELHLSIPDYAFYHSVIKELEYLVADLIILDNVSCVWELCIDSDLLGLNRTLLPITRNRPPEMTVITLLQS
jgi:hypothetical protein